MATLRIADKYTDAEAVAAVEDEVAADIASHSANVDAHHPETQPHAAHSGIGPDDHHPQVHTVASHPDTTATGAQLDTVTDGSEVDILHTHRGTFYIPIGGDSEDGLMVGT